MRTTSHEAAGAVREAAPWLVWLGRFGFAAKGVVYTLIGVLAVQTALGAGGELIGKTGALEHVGKAPFGRALLISTGVGIAGYALWRFVQAIMDTENKGRGAKGIAVRLGYCVIGPTHIALAASAFALVSGNRGSGDSTQESTAEVMSQPFGKWLVAGIGAIVIGYGLYQFYRAYSRKFRKKLLLADMSETEQKWATRLGCVGYAARGVVFEVIGTFLIIAAIHADPQEARGIDGALATLARQPWGWAVLGVVAAGLAAYGVYMFVEARYRRMVIR
jgi:hypothetical protein